MQPNVFPVFLGMSMIAALTSFRSSDMTGYHWCIFIYFVLNRVRYFYGDIQWENMSKEVRKTGVGMERSFGVILMIANLFLGVVIAIFLDDVKLFMWLSAVNLFAGTLYLFWERNTALEKSKDTGVVKVMKVQKHWIIFNIIEFIVFISMAFLFHTANDINHLISTITVIELQWWTFVIGFVILFFLMVLDWTIHHEFLFSEN